MGCTFMTTTTLFILTLLASGNLYSTIRISTLHFKDCAKNKISIIIALKNMTKLIFKTVIESIIC